MQGWSLIFFNVYVKIEDKLGDFYMKGGRGKGLILHDKGENTRI